ncbi:MAG: hypothetical protein IH878_14310, partial [Gemmatimonadetes bacterium]|nr:hypothetical protein [Gemmatimonadota bacterium]
RELQLACELAQSLQGLFGVALSTQDHEIVGIALQLAKVVGGVRGVPPIMVLEEMRTRRQIGGMTPHKWIRS